MATYKREGRRCVFTVTTGVSVHPSMCSPDSDLKDELHPVRAGVIQSLNILWHIHVEMGHTVFQLLIQFCNLNRELHKWSERQRCTVYPIS